MRPYRSPENFCADPVFSSLAGLVLLVWGFLLNGFGPLKLVQFALKLSGEAPPSLSSRQKPLPQVQARHWRALRRRLQSIEEEIKIDGSL